jgi:hypothetical protein
MNTNERDPRAHPGKKTRVDQFLVGLSCQPTIELASKYAGIAASTGYRWLQNPEISARRQELARETSRQAMTRLKEVTCRAVNQLGKLADRAESESTQVAACKAVLDFSLKVAELEDLQEQINEIQKILRSESRRWTNGSNQYQSDSSANRANGGGNEHG